MKRLLIVRHGESEWNSQRLLQGQADIGLTDRGAAQAVALADTIRKLAPGRVVSSDLKRALTTAHLLGFPDAEPRPELREIDVGAWTGEAIGDLVAADAGKYGGWRAGTYTPPDGESWQAFAGRTNQYVREALAGCDRLLVVAHGGVVRALLETLIGLPPKRIIPVGPASLTVLAEKPGEQGSMRLELFNYSPNGPVFDAPD